MCGRGESIFFGGGREYFIGGSVYSSYIRRHMTSGCPTISDVRMLVFILSYLFRSPHQQPLIHIASIYFIRIGK